MEAPKPTNPSKTKVNPITVNNKNFTLFLNFSFDTIKFTLMEVENEKSTPLKFEQSFSLNELNKISKWFKIFDTLEEVFEDISKIIKNKEVDVNLEDNVVHLVFQINIKKN